MRWGTTVENPFVPMPGLADIQIDLMHCWNLGVALSSSYPVLSHTGSPFNDVDQSSIASSENSSDTSGMPPLETPPNID